MPPNNTGKSHLGIEKKHGKLDKPRLPRLLWPKTCLETSIMHARSFLDGKTFVFRLGVSVKLSFKREDWNKRARWKSLAWVVWNRKRASYCFAHLPPFQDIHTWICVKKLDVHLTCILFGECWGHWSAPEDGSRHTQYLKAQDIITLMNSAQTVFRLAMYWQTNNHQHKLHTMTCLCFPLIMTSHAWAKQHTPFNDMPPLGLGSDKTSKADISLVCISMMVFGPFQGSEEKVAHIQTLEVILPAIFPAQPPPWTLI